MELRARALSAGALVVVGLLGVNTVAHAVTTEVRVVNGFAYYDEATGVEVEPDTGWWADGSGTGTVEIGSAYRAPDGLGREAVMLDTPATGDTVELYARTEQPPLQAAFPEMLRAAPDTRLGFWLYLSSDSTTTEAGPVLTGWIGVGGGGVRYEIVTFDPVANGYDQHDTWMYVDTTAPGALWTVHNRNSENVVSRMTWDALVAYTRTTDDGVDYWGAFEYGLHVVQDTPGTYSAIDGLSAGTDTWSTVVDFELDPTSARPVLDDCKEGRWQTNYPANQFRNQGACIAAIVAAN